MAKEQVSTEKKKGLNIKVLLFGFPIFVLQLVLVYVITTNILLDKIIEQKLHGGEIDSTLAEELLDPIDPEDEHVEVVIGQFIYNMEDVVVNPAGTNGQRFLLLSMGFDVPSQEITTIFETKQIIIKDMIITYLSSKSLEEVSQPQFKSELKEGLIASIEEMIPEIKINTVYFSKYIVN